MVFVVLFVLTVSPIVHREEQVEALYTPSVSSVTVTSSSNVAAVDITPNNSKGTFVSSISDVAFEVATDNLTGYTLALSPVGDDISGQLINTSHGDTLDTVAGPVDETTFATGVATSYVNKWGIKSSKYNASTSAWDALASGNYLPAPKTTNTILDTTTVPNTTPNQYKVGIGARVDYEKTIGTYTNTYVLQAVGNQITYTINYADTSSDASTVTLPAVDNASSVEASGFALSSSAIASRANYVFYGWCYGTVNHATNPSTCSGTVYQPGDSFTFSSLSITSANVANVYAMWKQYVYTVSYNCNSGSSCPSNATIANNSNPYTYTIPNTTPTRTGYTFNGYTGSDGNSYTKGGTIAFTSGVKDTITLTAKWTLNNYTVSVTAGGTTVGATSLSIPFGGSKTVTVSPGTGYYISSMSCPTGYTCSGFTPGTAATGSYTVTVKNNGASNSATGGTLTFARKARTFTVTLNQQSGSGGTGSVTATYNSAMPAITKPSRANYTFGGYYTGTNGSGTQYYNANGASVRSYTLTSGTTLYAKWTRNTITLINGQIHSGFNFSTPGYLYTDSGAVVPYWECWDSSNCANTWQINMGSVSGYETHWKAQSGFADDSNWATTTQSTYNLTDLNKINFGIWVRGYNDGATNSNKRFIVHLCTQYPTTATSLDKFGCSRIINNTYNPASSTGYNFSADISGYNGNYYIRIHTIYTSSAQINVGGLSLTAS